MLVRVSALVAALAAVASASNVLEVTSATFDSVIGKGKPALVEYFAPWCGHCKNLAPIYEQLADAYAHAKDKVLIVKVDADGEGKEAASKAGVTGFPTLKWYGPNDATEATTYEGGRELDQLAAFVAEKSGVKAKIKAPPPPATLQLDYLNFDEVVYNADNDVLVAFTAPWCGHCKNMKPSLEKVAENFSGEKNCIVANFDADAAKNKGVAERFGVKSYPTIKFFPKGSSTKEPVAYDSGRNEEAFTKYLNEKCGTSRAVGGGLNDLAGRHPEFDSLASQFFAAYTAGQSAVTGEIFREAKSLAASAGAAGKHYLKVMEKLANGTEDYLTKETARLNNILRKRTMSPSKLDEIKIRANVLAAFAKKKVEEAEEAAEEAAAAAAEKAEEVVQKVKEEL